MNVGHMQIEYYLILLGRKLVKQSYAKLKLELKESNHNKPLHRNQRTQSTKQTNATLKHSHSRTSLRPRHLCVSVVYVCVCRLVSYQQNVGHNRPVQIQRHRPEKDEHIRCHGIRGHHKHGAEQKGRTDQQAACADQRIGARIATLQHLREHRAQRHANQAGHHCDAAKHEGHTAHAGAWWWVCVWATRPMHFGAL